MSLCWSNEPDLRPSATAMVQLTSPWWRTDDSGTAISGIHNPLYATRTRPTAPPDTGTVEPNGLCYVRTVHRICSMDVVTCAALDEHDSLWLGGYRQNGTDRQCSKDSSGGDNESHTNRDGLLLCTNICEPEPSQPRLVDRWHSRWPTGWSHLHSKLRPSQLRWLGTAGEGNQSEWPEQLCPVKLSGITGQCDVNSKVTVVHYQLICVRSGQIGLLELQSKCEGDAIDRVRLLHTVWISTPDSPSSICCGLVVPVTSDCSDSFESDLEVWFGGSRGQLICYNLDHVRPKLSSVAPLSRTTNTRSVGTIHYRLSWPASPNACDLSVVTALTLTTDRSGSDGLGTVWSCLCPDLHLTCWSIRSRAALRTLILCQSSTVPTVMSHRSK
ncbi:unnamed protein product [Echinostoma caproni]|uniref:TFIIIC_delta domain-containing protein n=1 Tax=Echinostoma caproni TaxID=27848 RepID=A0A183B7M5_9TREM|nr:unnamed protein product [Echinostoma caproni]